MKEFKYGKTKYRFLGHGRWQIFLNGGWAAEPAPFIPALVLKRCADLTTPA